MKETLKQGFIIGSRWLAWGVQAINNYHVLTRETIDIRLIRERAASLGYSPTPVQEKVVLASDSFCQAIQKKEIDPSLEVPPTDSIIVDLVRLETALEKMQEVKTYHLTTVRRGLTQETRQYLRGVLSRKN